LASVLPSGKKKAPVKERAEKIRGGNEIPIRKKPKIRGSEGKEKGSLQSRKGRVQKR